MTPHSACDIELKASFVLRVLDYEACGWTGVRFDESTEHKHNLAFLETM